jgi:hypothetical protein
MKDIIIDVYRRGRGYSKTSESARARLKSADPENLPKFLSNRFIRNSYPNYRLAPLDKFLQKHVGRPWDDVYSEIREHCDTRNIRGQHLWEHVIQYVHESWPWRWYRFGFYVEDGILCHVPRTKYERPVPPVTKIEIDENNWFEYCEYVNHDGRKHSVQPKGQWYHFWRKLYTYTVPTYEGYGLDRVQTGFSIHTREVITKRQCGKKALKRIRQRITEIQAP